MVQGCLFAYNWNWEMGKVLNGSFHAGLLVFGLIMQVKELMLFTVKTVDGFEPESEVIQCM